MTAARRKPMGERNRSLPEKVVVCFGDATAAVPVVAGERWPSRLRLLLRADEGATYRVIDAEAPGLTAAEALARIDNQVLFHRPQLVTLRFGPGDSVGPAPTPLDRFEATLRALAQLIRARTAAIVTFVLTPAPVPPGASPSGDAIRPYHDVTRRVAYELNAPLLDLRDAIGRVGAVQALGAALEERAAAAQQARYAELVEAFLRRLL